MGKLMTGLTRTFAKDAAPTPLLQFLAGEHALAIAQAFPAPHAEYLALPAARRHAAAILLARAGRMEHIAHDVVFARDGELARLLMHGEAPGGLIKALGRCGELLWKGADYAYLLDIFRNEDGAQVVRHMPALQPARLRTLAALPMALRKAAILRHIPETPGAAEDLAEAFNLAFRVQPQLTVAALVERWGRAESPKHLFRMAQEALDPPEFAHVLPRPAIDFADPILNRKALDGVALEFQNCLRDQAAQIAAGHMLVFVQRTVEPAIVFALRQDTLGWRLAEAKLCGNEAVADGPLQDLVRALEAAGVRMGEPLGNLRERLHEHVCVQCGPPDPVDRTTWRARLQLGDLWA
jgi:hypothetical protein